MCEIYIYIYVYIYIIHISITHYNSHTPLPKPRKVGGLGWIWQGKELWQFDGYSSNLVGATTATWKFISCAARGLCGSWRQADVNAITSSKSTALWHAVISSACATPSLLRLLSIQGHRAAEQKGSSMIAPKSFRMAHCWRWVHLVAGSFTIASLVLPCVGQQSECAPWFARASHTPKLLYI